MGGVDFNPTCIHSFQNMHLEDIMLIHIHMHPDHTTGPGYFSGGNLLGYVQAWLRYYGAVSCLQANTFSESIKMQLWLTDLSDWTEDSG